GLAVEVAVDVTVAVRATVRVSVALADGVAVTVGGGRVAVLVDVDGAVAVDVGAAGMPPPPSPHAASTQSMARTAGKRIRRASLSEKPRVKPTDVHTEARSHGEDLCDSVTPCLRVSLFPQRQSSMTNTSGRLKPASLGRCIATPWMKVRKPRASS